MQIGRQISAGTPPTGCRSQAAAAHEDRFSIILMGPTMPAVHDQIIAALEDGIIQLDRAGCIVTLNPAARRLLGLAQAPALLGAQAAEALHDWPMISAALAAPVPVVTTVEMPLAEGETPRTCELHTLIVGENEGTAVIVRDITERAEKDAAVLRASEIARQARQTQTEMLSRISHDIRTPLAVIRGYTELIQGGYFEDDLSKRRHALKNILDNADYLEYLVTELIELEQLSNGRITLKPVPFVLREWADSALDAMVILAENKGIAFTYTVDTALPASIIGDSDRLQQVVVNLTSNAIKFTQTGSVSITMAPCGPDCWTIAVADTGPGIPPEMQQAIFEPFRQIATDPQRKKGFGLGLSIVRDLVQLMNGSIQLTSQVGTGSTFTVTLPLTVPERIRAS